MDLIAQEKQSPHDLYLIRKPNNRCEGIPTLILLKKLILPQHQKSDLVNMHHHEVR